ncbi:hypothetical protein [Stigmatella erecta]|uniref:Uncharacterized protein n=1 Tax=Stigmatella erecta TaxID=83460 RepID=A0A1I0JHQ3_9BACT|nr:hypothetical protein [Stigmatella erecta]SEU09836.1 hypothetical protein SAMN05443639_107297 [Stigmatella erecta]
MVPPLGTVSDIRDVAREVLGEEAAARYEQRIHRWTGPEDVVGEAGAKPYEGRQLTFQECPWQDTLRLADLDRVLRGTVQVMRGPGGQTDYVLRDHHMLDVVLYHYRTAQALPSALFHADRHSDWCKDSYLEARIPQQAATWWRLLEGLKRPGSGAPVLTEQDVHFTTAAASRTGSMSGRDVGASVRVPWFLEPAQLQWSHLVEQPQALASDWVSLDLDFFQPAPQLRVSRGLLRDARFQGMLAQARVRVFVLSPQFTNGGDRIEPWEVQGSVPSSLRLLNLLRHLPGRARLRP